MPDSLEITCQLVGGLLLLLIGGETLLRGGCRLAAALGMPPVLVALTVLAFGSSAPELFVCIEAAYRGQEQTAQADLVLGNVLGSNLANFALVVGLAATLRVIPVERRLLKVEVPLLLFLQVLLFPLMADAVLSRWEAMLLFGIGVVYVAMIVRSARRSRDQTRSLDHVPASAPEQANGKPGLLGAVGWTTLGLVLLPVGADMLVQGGTRMGHALDLSTRFIGLTATAIGTSLPEVATTLLAIRRGNFSVAAGTVFGSNVFNLCYALGFSASLFPLHFTPTESRHITVDLAATLALTAFLSFACLRRGRLNRRTGLTLLCAYIMVLSYGLWTGRVAG